jgi:hypothetical protein
LPELHILKNNSSDTEEFAPDELEAVKLKIEGAIVVGFEKDEHMVYTSF